VQIGRVGLARVKHDDDAFSRKIDSDIAHAIHFHQYLAQFSYALIAIFAFSCDLDCFENGVVGAFGIKRVARFGFVWSCGIHHLSYLACWCARNFARDRFERAPDVFGENVLASCIRMNPVRQIQ